MKTSEDFENAVKQHNIDHWPIHNCSMCDYECGYIFSFNPHDVVYDAGCDCTRRREILLRDWSNVAEQYNLNINNPETMKKYNEFWKFDNE